MIPMKTFKRIILRLVSVFFAFILGFVVSDSWYFNAHPLLTSVKPVHTLSVHFFLTHMGQMLVGTLLATVSYIWLPYLLISFKRWFSNLITQIVFQTLTEFFKEQNRRLAEARAAGERSRAEKAARLQAEKEAKALRQKRFEEIGLKNSVVIDTSALIDGRILAVTESGFIESPLIVPQCVIDELQHLADSPDKLRRERGRLGLDVLNSLKKLKKPKLTILTYDEVGDEPVVDKRLVILCKKYGCRLLTVDFNLNKVAQASGIRVLNVNNLATALRTVLIPGESLSLKITNVGKDATQGVGYLQDGTMIVVEDCGSKVGQEVKVEVTRILQTPAGKMFFGKQITN